MFTHVNTDLGARIKAATEAIVSQNAVSKMVSKAARFSLKDQEVGGIKRHNTGMFAHKQAAWDKKA